MRVQLDLRHGVASSGTAENGIARGETRRMRTWLYLFVLYSKECRCTHLLDGARGDEHPADDWPLAPIHTDSECQLLVLLSRPPPDAAS